MTGLKKLSKEPLFTLTINGQEHLVPFEVQQAYMNLESERDSLWIANRNPLTVMRNILPAHYTCEEKENGIHCYSEKGISEGWDAVMLAVKNWFGDKFLEVYHKTCTNHLEFTVFLKA